MRLRTRLLVFGYPLLEVATAYLVAVWIGWGWMLLLLLAGIPAGFAVMRNAGDAAMRDVRAAQAAGDQAAGMPVAGAPRDPGRHAMAFVAGLLIAVPGFWTDLVGLLLLLPPTRRLFSRRAQGWIDGRVTTVRMPGVRYPSGDVVQGTVIREHDEGPPAPRADGPSGQIPPA